MDSVINREDGDGALYIFMRNIVCCLFLLSDNLFYYLDSLSSEEALSEGGTIILSTIIRQQDDSSFIDILNQIRIGAASPAALKALNE